MEYNVEPDWDKIVIDIGPNLYRYFCGSFSEALAADLTQETLIRLVQKYQKGHFDPQKGSFLSYAYGIAKFVRLEALKKDAGFDLVDDEKKIEVGVDTIVADEVTHLRWAISQLSSTEQDVILLLIDEDMSLEQIANSLDIPLGTIKSHIHRAKDKIRHLMEVQR